MVRRMGASNKLLLIAAGGLNVEGCKLQVWARELIMNLVFMRAIMKHPLRHPTSEGINFFTSEKGRKRGWLVASSSDIPRDDKSLARPDHLLRLHHTRKRHPTADPFRPELFLVW